MIKTKIKWRKRDRYAFEVYQDNKRKWRWRVRSRNGRILFASSEGYQRRSRAWSGVDEIGKFRQAYFCLNVAYA